MNPVPVSEIVTASAEEHPNGGQTYTNMLAGGCHNCPQFRCVRAFEEATQSSVAPHGNRGGADALVLCIRHHL